MTEAQNNANPANFESLSESIESNSSNPKIIATETTIANGSDCQNSNLFLDNSEDEKVFASDRATEKPVESTSDKTMNWQKVAHKLREYNRKLLKKVFRLEQEFEDLNDLYQQSVEKSRSSDILVAQQEAEIRQHQEKIAQIDQVLADFQTTIENKETQIASITQQYEIAQQQTAQLERQCTLLQETCNHQTYEAISKDRQIQELKSKLEKQQRLALQYNAELQREREKTKVVPTIPQKKSTADWSNVRPSDRRTTHSSQRKIEPWSANDNSEPKITLPKTKSAPLTAQKLPSSETIKTAAKIATWNTSPAHKSTPSTSQENVPSTPQSSSKVKLKSLAAVDLPTFPKRS